MLSSVIYYLALPLIYTVSYLPFSALYLFSDFLYLVIFRTLGYRNEIIYTNLKNSFPEKSELELKKIMSDYQRWFCDLTLETLKNLTISESTLRKRVKFDEGIEIFREYHKKGQSIIAVMGHYGNWEWGGSRYAMEKDINKLYIIYHKLHNPHFDKMMCRLRTRTGAGLYAKKDTFRGMVKNKEALTSTAFVSDQTPAPESAYWMNFLHQDTAVFMGTEKMAKRFNYPIIYITFKRIKRGYYEILAELLVEDPSKTKEFEITELHTKRLEKDIIDQPETWLWSHRRWKHKRVDPSVDS